MTDNPNFLLAITIFNQAILFVLLCVMFYGFILAAAGHRRRFIRPIYARSKARIMIRVLRRLLCIPPSGSRFIKERQQLLIGCGLTWDVERYELLKRVIWLVLMIIAVIVYSFTEKLHDGLVLHFRIFVIAVLFFAFSLLFDKWILESVMRYRRARIIGDIYSISRQLLYYTGSSMNLHAKLVRCLPYAASIRNELYLLTNDWYRSAETAIAKFKQSIGTEEGYSFAETLNSLRQHENEQYYVILRQRVQDYKEKLEFSREGRRETLSYLLFIMAGIPILFTFRLFIYPWVAEGQKLFEALG